MGFLLAYTARAVLDCTLPFPVFLFTDGLLLRVVLCGRREGRGVHAENSKSIQPVFNPEHSYVRQQHCSPVNPVLYPVQYSTVQVSRFRSRI